VYQSKENESFIIFRKLKMVLYLVKSTIEMGIVNLLFFSCDSLTIEINGNIKFLKVDYFWALGKRNSN